VLELQHEKAIVLAGRPERAALGVKVGLRRSALDSRRNR
jgi:hypothetical protein